MLTKATAEKLEAEGGVAAPAAEEAAPAEEPVAVAAEATETPAE